MKKLIVAALLIVGMTSFAQEKRQRPERAEMEKLTPEQRTQLAVKELTLKLDLNASQQKDMGKIISELDAKREAAKADFKANKTDKKKLTADERFALKNKMLDDQIAMKDRVKKILTPDQMAKWEKIQENRRGKMERMRKDKGPRPEKPEQK